MAIVKNASTMIDEMFKLDNLKHNLKNSKGEWVHAAEEKAALFSKTFQEKQKLWMIILKIKKFKYKNFHFV